MPARYILLLLLSLPLLAGCDFTLGGCPSVGGSYDTLELMAYDRDVGTSLLVATIYDRRRDGYNLKPSYLAFHPETGVVVYDQFGWFRAVRITSGQRTQEFDFWSLPPREGRWIPEVETTHVAIEGVPHTPIMHNRIRIRDLITDTTFVYEHPHTLTDSIFVHISVAAPYYLAEQQQLLFWQSRRTEFRKPDGSFGARDREHTTSLVQLSLATGAVVVHEVPLGRFWLDASVEAATFLYKTLESELVFLDLQTSQVQVLGKATFARFLPYSNQVLYQNPDEADPLYVVNRDGTGNQPFSFTEKKGFPDLRGFIPTMVYSTGQEIRIQDFPWPWRDGEPGTSRLLIRTEAPKESEGTHTEIGVYAPRFSTDGNSIYYLRTTYTTYDGTC